MARADWVAKVWRSVDDLRRELARRLARRQGADDRSSRRSGTPGRLGSRPAEEARGPGSRRRPPTGCRGPGPAAASGRRPGDALPGDRRRPDRPATSASRFERLARSGTLGRPRRTRRWSSRRSRELVGAGHDRLEHRVQVQRRADRPADFAQRRELPTDRVSSAVRARTPVNRRTFSMAITAWLANVWRSAICFSVKVRTSSRAMTITPMGVPSAASAPPALSEPRTRPRVAMLGYSGSLRDVRACGRRGRRTARLAGDPPGASGTRRRWHRRAGDTWCATRREDSPSNRNDRRSGRHRRAAFSRDRVEHRLDVGRRARDHPQDFAGRRLLLQRLGQLAVPGLELREQPHVLDGDDRLVGERLRECDLLGREGMASGPRLTKMTPSGMPSRSSGVASIVRRGTRPCSGTQLPGTPPRRPGCPRRGSSAGRGPPVRRRCRG